MTLWLRPVIAGLIKQDHAREVVSPAYDLFTPIERGEHARQHPRSFLNGTPSEGDDPDLDYDGRRQQATSYLTSELGRGTWDFRPPGYFILKIQSGAHTQVGVVGDVPHDSYPGAIRPHEATRPGRVDDLIDYLETVGSGSSPVGLAYRRDPAIDLAIARITARQPAIDVTFEDGDRQRVWRASQDEELMAALAEIDSAYIIDGHHRVAATVARGRDPSTPAGRFLAVAFPADSLAVFPFHRWVDVPIDEIGAQPGPLKPAPGQAVAVTKAGEWSFDLHPAADESDVSALARGMLAALGIADERTDPRLRFLPGFPDDEALRKLVANEGGVGFILAPGTIDEVLAVSDRGEFMPPKATFFSPKPRSGLFLVKR
ncbi:DUF1015 family protein [soil metagenome]